MVRPKRQSAELTAWVPDPFEFELWTVSRGPRGGKARESLFAMYLPFAHGIARRHYLDRQGGDIDLGDLRQLASVGLLEAIGQFDPSVGVPFRSFARRRIAGSVVDGIAKMSEVREQIASRSRARRERLRSLTNDHDRPATFEQTLQLLGELAAGLAIGFMLEGTSLYTENEAKSLDASPYDSLAWQQLLTRLRHELAGLPSREALILRQHYLEGYPFETLAAQLDLSPGRVSQLHRAAILALRKRLTGMALPDHLR